MRVRVRDLDPPLAGLPAAAPTQASAAEESVVAGVLSLLEGSPVLGFQMTVTEEQELCYRHVGELRRLLADSKLLLPEDSAAQPMLSAIRAACRKYLDEAEAWDRKAGRRWSLPSFRFYQALGALRATVGLCVWRLAEAYDLDVEGRMTAIFPGAQE